MKLFEILVKSIFVLSMLFSCKHSSVTKSAYCENLNKDSVYLIFRGTESKEGGLAKKFNLSHKKVSHVGVLLFYQDKWNVFHVLNHYVNQSCFRMENVESFLNIKEENIDYISIYHAMSFDKREAVTKAEEIMKENVSFNYRFSTDMKTELYCSQVVVKILENSIQKFNYYEKAIENPQYKIFIKKDTISYYPVDMFFHDERFRKKYEWIKE